MKVTFKVFLIVIALYCLSACGTRITRSALLSVQNDGSDPISIRVAGQMEIEEISREWKIPPHSTFRENWEFKTKPKNHRSDGGYGADIIATRPNGAYLLWKRFENFEDLKIQIRCDSRNCLVE